MSAPADRSGSARSFGCPSRAAPLKLRNSAKKNNFLEKQQKQPAPASASPPSARVGEGEDPPSSISDSTRRDANGGHNPSRNDANKDGDDATTRHAIHPSNAKSIRSTNTALLPVERRQRCRSPRRRASSGRIFSSLYLLDACRLTVQRGRKANYSR